MRIQVNYKNADWFKYHFDEILSDPEVWKKGTGDKSLSGWANQLLKYAEDNNFKHVIENRIYYSFLLAAKLYNKMKSQFKKNIPLKKWREIYRSSDFEQFKSDFFINFTKKAKIFRLSRIISTSIDHINNIAADIETLLRENESKVKNVFEIVSNVESILDQFESRCVEYAKVEIKNVIENLVFSSSDVDEKLRKLHKKNFEKYMTQLFEQTNEAVCCAQNKIIGEEIKNINSSLKSYGVEYGNDLDASNGILYDPDEQFKTNAKINPLKAKELYILPMVGMGLVFLVASAATGSLPILLGISAAEGAAGELAKNIIDYKTSNTSNLFKQRNEIRQQEIKMFFDNMKNFYINASESYIHNYSERIRQCDKLNEYRKDIQNGQAKSERFKSALKNLDKAIDNTLWNYSVELLKICQKNAVLKSYSIKHSNMHGFPELDIFADNCTEEILNDMRCVIHIKEG